MMANIIDLPTELIQHVSAYLGHELLDLRLTCRAMQERTEARIGAKYFKNRTVFVNLRKSLDDLYAISLSSRFSRYVEKLILDNHRLTNEYHDRFELPHEDNHPDGIHPESFFKYWFEQEHLMESENSVTMIAGAMRALPRLSGLSFEHYEQHPLPSRVIKEVWPTCNQVDCYGNFDSKMATYLARGSNDSAAMNVLEVLVAAPETSVITQIDLRAQICTDHVFDWTLSFRPNLMAPRLLRLKRLRVRLDYRNASKYFASFISMTPDLELLTIIVQEKEYENSDFDDPDRWNAGSTENLLADFVRTISSFRLSKLREFTLKTDCDGTCNLNTILRFVEAHGKTLRRLKLQQLSIRGGAFEECLNLVQTLNLERFWWYDISNSGYSPAWSAHQASHAWRVMMKGAIAEGDVAGKIKNMVVGLKTNSPQWCEGLTSFEDWQSRK